MIGNNEEMIIIRLNLERKLLEVTVEHNSSGSDFLFELEILFLIDKNNSCKTIAFATIDWQRLKNKIVKFSNRVVLLST